MIDEFFKLSQHFLEIKNQAYRRYFIQKLLDKPKRLSIIVGQRGVGKTTTLIQYLLAQVNGDRFNQQILYVQSDHFLLGTTTLYEIAEKFHLLGGKWIAFDEIHKYADWSKELKSIYDTFPDLNILASGSSALEIHKGTHDLSRRAVVETMYGLSFREYLELTYELKFANHSLEQILKNHQLIVDDILKMVSRSNKKILPHFLDYLKRGYYPYFTEVNDLETFYLLIEQNLHTTIESDLVSIYPHLTGNSIKKIKQLLSFIASSVPFIPNWQKIKSLLDIGDERTLKTYFKYLEDASVIQTIQIATKKMKKIELPEKIYLNNSNQMCALTSDQNKGTLRETFFLNMLSTQFDVTLPGEGDFLINEKYLFEVGGRNKDFHQVEHSHYKDVFLACDEIEIGINKKIPLWLFGFIY